MILNKPSKSLLALIGPSIVFVALSLNGGELLLWPNLIAKHGLQILWPIPIILLFQFVVNLEIERYTAVTGKNTLQGLIQVNNLIAWLFPFAILISLVWPAWASPAGNMLAYLMGNQGLGPWFAMLIMILLILIWNSKNSYSILELVSKIGLSLTVVAVSITIILNWRPEIGLEYLNGIMQFGKLPEGLDRFTFLSALAYGGVAGVLNLVQSDWIKSKKYAAAAEDKPEQIDWNATDTINNWRSWWSLIWKEHLILFYIGNIVGISLLAILAALILKDNGSSGFSLLTEEVRLINISTPGLGVVFGLAVVILFTMAQMTILEAQGQLLEKCIPEKMRFGLNNKKLSQLVGLLGIIILLITAIVPTFNQPLILLQISASLSAVIMALYPPLLLVLNSKLPKQTQASLLVKALVLACSVFYGLMVIWSLGWVKM